MAGHKTESEIKHNIDLGSFLMSWVMAGSEIKSKVWFLFLSVSTMTLILWPAMTNQGAHKVESAVHVLVELCSQMEGGLLLWPWWLIVAVCVVCGCLHVWVGVFVSGSVTLFSSCFFPALSFAVLSALSCAWMPQCMGVHCSTSLVQQDSLVVELDNHMIVWWWNSTSLKCLLTRIIIVVIINAVTLLLMLCLWIVRATTTATCRHAGSCWRTRWSGTSGSRTRSPTWRWGQQK